MARIRTIKPEFWTHEDLSALPEATHMLAAALLNHADDEGYFNANPGLVRAACCPLREPSVSVQDSLRLLAGIGFIKLGTGSDGKRYGMVVTFDDHQRVNRPTLSKIKGLVDVWEESRSAHAHLSEDSPPERKGTGKGKEENEKLPPTAGASPPSAEPDPIFGTGLAFLVSKGVSEKGARSFLGLMRKECGNLLTAELLLQAEREDVSEPVAWLRAAGKARAGPTNGKRPPVNASFAGKDYSIGATPDDELFDFGPH